MHYTSVRQFLDTARLVLSTGPVALIFDEDGVEIEGTLRHHENLGFARVIVFSAEDPLPAEGDLARVEWVPFEPGARAEWVEVVNQCLAAAPGVWFYYGFNAEYLFYPFCETRSVGELLTFNAEERRNAMLTSVVDLYAGDFQTSPIGVAPENCFLDRAGYYALDRFDEDGTRLDGQYDLYGGLRWRFEEFVPADKRRIDRVALVRAEKGLRLRPDLTFSDPERNTVACPWHHSLTGAVCSFRAAKALKSNPGSSFDIPSFTWPQSEPFRWSSQQLMDLGLMEPGQWF